MTVLLQYSRLAVLALAVAAVAAAQTHYPDRYDQVNVGEVLANRRLFTPFVNCIMDRGRCTSQGRELKNHLADALRSGCARCTPKQQAGATLVIQHLIHREPAVWRELTRKYDPQALYRTKYEAFAASKGVVLPKPKP